MPHLTSSLTDGCALVDLSVGVSIARRNAALRAGKTVPAPLKIRGLIDTGASCVVLDPSVIAELQVTPTGFSSIYTPSTGGTPVPMRTFDVAVYLHHPTTNYTMASAVPAVESPIAAYGPQAIIGRSVLNKCLLIYDGAANTFTISF